MKASAPLLGFWLVLVGTVMGVRVLAQLLAAPEGAMLDALGQPFNAAPRGLVGTPTGLGFLLMGAWLTGRVFARIGLPRISGYLLFGVLVGPGVAAALPGAPPALVPAPQLGYLKLIDSLAIALIALFAGSEIRVDFLRRNLGRVGLIVAIEATIVFFGVGSLLLLARPFIPLLRDLPAAVSAVVCAVLAMLAVGNSPAVVIGMITETRASGAMARTALAVTVCKDLVIIVLFAILMSLGVAIIDDAPALGGMAAPERDLLKSMAWHLLGSLGAGVVIGLLMRLLITRIGNHVAVFVLGAGFAMALCANALHLEPLLVALTAGFLMANLWPEATRRLFHSAEELSLPVYCVFFSVAGAGISVEALQRLWPVALAIVAVRLTLVWLGTAAGCRAARLELPARRWLWTAIIPQAGVTLALTTQAHATFANHEWAAGLHSLMLAIIAIHELIGPPLMRLGLLRCGEIAAPMPHRTLRPAPGDSVTT